MIRLYWFVAWGPRVTTGFGWLHVKVPRVNTPEVWLALSNQRRASMMPLRFAIGREKKPTELATFDSCCWGHLPPPLVAGDYFVWLQRPNLVTYAKASHLAKASENFFNVFSVFRFVLCAQHKIICLLHHVESTEFFLFLFFVFKPAPPCPPPKKKKSVSTIDQFV